MKPPRFLYCVPDMLDEALALLNQYGEDTKVLAGGQSLIPLLNMRLAGPAHLLDINHISELNYIESEDGYLAIGAIVRQRQLERASQVKEQHPLLLEVIKHIGHMQIRNRGTVVGSIAHADPAAELPALLTCLDGEVVALSANGERVMRAEEFFTGYLSTALHQDEMLTEVRFPWIPPQSGWAFMEFARRSGDYALVGAVAIVTPDPNDRCISAQISYLGISGSPIRAREVENILSGSKIDEQTLEQAAEVARSYVSNDMEDVHATVDYRCALTAEITKRVVRAAWARCKQSNL